MRISSSIVWNECVSPGGLTSAMAQRRSGARNRGLIRSLVGDLYTQRWRGGRQRSANGFKDVETQELKHQERMHTPDEHAKRSCENVHQHNTNAQAQGYGDQGRFGVIAGLQCVVP